MRKNHEEGVLRVSGSEGNFEGGEYISRSVCVRTGICGSPERRWQKAEDWEGGRKGARKGGRREREGKRDDGKVARATCNAC
jgi:hypothetical protein